MLITSSPASSQQDIHKVADDILLGTIKWSNDSTEVYFLGYNDKWFKYDVNQNNVIDIGKNPFSWKVTGSEIIPFNPVLDDEGYIPYVFLSPDETYLIYPFNQRRQRSIGYPLAIVNLRNQDTIVTSIYVNPFIGFSSFNVTWSEDSTAFVVSNFEGFAYTFYYMGNLFSNTGFTIENTTNIIEGEQSVITEFFDINSRGDLILLQYSSQFAVWAPETNSAEVVDVNVRIADMAFVDDESILYISDTGLYQFNIETESTQVLNDSIKSSQLGAYFSPDACHLVFLDVFQVYGEEDTLYYYNICG